MIETQDLTRQLMQRENESLRQQLSDLQAKYDAREQECRTAFGKEMELIKQLAECERERELYKVKAVIADMPMSEVEVRLKKQLATVTAERDEYATALGRTLSIEAITAFDKFNGGE